MGIIYTIILSIICGYFYRLGGSANKPKWIWKARDLWCGVCVIAWLSLNGISSWLFIPCVGLMWASLSSYFNKKNADEHWWNFALHGFFIGFSLFPLVTAGHLHWLPVLYRSFVLSVTFALCTQFIRKDVVSEAGRGVLIILTLLLI